MKKETKELKGKSILQITKDVQTLREEIAKLKLEVKVNPQKDTNIIGKKKKKIATLLTVLSELTELEKIKSSQAR